MFLCSLGVCFGLAVCFGSKFAKFVFFWSWCFDGFVLTLVVLLIDFGVGFWYSRNLVGFDVWGGALMFGIGLEFWDFGGLICLSQAICRIWSFLDLRLVVLVILVRFGGCWVSQFWAGFLLFGNLFRVWCEVCCFCDFDLAFVCGFGFWLFILFVCGLG